MTTKSKIKKLQEHHCCGPLMKQLKKITKKKFPECLSDIGYIIMLDRESNHQYVLENGDILTTQCNCICGVNIRYNYFFRVKNTNKYLVIGDTCQNNISDDLKKLTNKNESNIENQEATKNWKKMRNKAIREKKSLDNENNDCFEKCKICNLKLVRAYCEPKEGDEYLKEKKYTDKRKLEVCTDCLEKNVMNCDTCKKEMCIQLRNDKVQKKCNNCIKKKYQQDFNPCIICDRYFSKKPSRETICEKCISDNKKICCRGCQKKIELDVTYYRPKLYCKHCYFNNNGKEETKIFWKEYNT